MYARMNAGANGRHVLVVGGAGYVGNVLVRKLLAAGYGVRVLDCLLFDHGSALAGVFEEPGFSFLHGDLRRAADVEGALDGITDVVLLAALVGDPICRKYPDLAREVNTDGARLLFDSLPGAGIDRFVFTSTCSNYGLRGSEEPATEESELAPLSLYAETKVEFERFVLERESEWGGLCPTLLRIATAYGLSQRMRFDLTISEFTRTLAIGEELVVYDADTWRPYCHVADISRAIITVLEAPGAKVRGEVFNVGHSDENHTKRMVVDAVQEHLGGTGKVRFTEGGQDARNYRVAFDKIRERLGFEAAHRVPDTAGRLIEAIRAGAFTDVDARPSFYTNHAVVGLDAAAVHEARDGDD
jgi:nucleoside-diphosphate-sugar epimerase